MRFVLAAIAFVGLSFIFMLTANPFGLAQRIVWGQKPPYHWEKEDGDLTQAELYVGSNGNTCATVYYTGETKGFDFANPASNLSDTWTYYGYGFGGTSTKAKAEKLAENECE